MCLCVLSAGINQSVCGAELLPTMKPFSGPVAFYQYTHTHTHTHTLSETPRGGCLGSWVCERDEVGMCVFCTVEMVHEDIKNS